MQATEEDRDSGRGWRPRDEMGLSEGDSGSGRGGHKDCEGMGTRQVPISQIRSLHSPEPDTRVNALALPSLTVHP